MTKGGIDFDEIVFINFENISEITQSIFTRRNLILKAA